MKIYKIVSPNQVYVEMNQTILWYNNQIALLGKHFLKQISKSVGLISQFPHVTYIRYSPQIRCCIISHFPYMIHYQVDKDKQAIYIIAILHMRRRGSER
jgi:hypothetical protein